jgi:hypothetical protein
MSTAKGVFYEQVTGVKVLFLVFSFIGFLLLLLFELADYLCRVSIGSFDSYGFSVAVGGLTRNRQNSEEKPTRASLTPSFEWLLDLSELANGREQDAVSPVHFDSSSRSVEAVLKARDRSFHC